MAVIPTILKTLAGAKRWRDFLSEWMKGVPNGDPDFTTHLKNGRALYESLSKEEQSSSQASSILAPTSVGQGGFISQTMAAQYHPSTMYLQEMGTLESLKTGLGGLAKILSGHPLEGLDQIGDVITREVVLYLTQTNKLFQEINEKAMMTGELANVFRDEIQMAAPEATRLGISYDEFATSVGDLVTNSGKFKLMSGETMKEMALASKFTQNMGEFVAMGRKFELIGLGMNDMSRSIKDMSMDSLTLGLNGKTITKTVSDNLERINRYGFKDGVEGLSRMAQKSVEFRMNMSEVFKLADAVWEPDKALDLVANLQVIGGAFGDLNDPIKLMYMATNNVEGLQDALIGAAESLVTYNDEQGRFEITGVNLRRAKAIAEETGVVYEELANGAVAAAERTAAAFDLASSSYEMDEKQIEFLTNLARMEGGKMIIDIPKPLREQLGLTGEETQIALESMQEWQKDVILGQQEAFKILDPKDIPRAQVMALEQIQRDASALRGYVRVMVGHNAATVIEEAIGLNGDMVKQMSESFTNLSEARIEKADERLQGVIRQVINAEGISNFREDFINVVDNLIEKWDNKTEKIQKGEINAEASSINSAKMENSKRNETTPPPASNYVERVKVDVTLNPMSASLDRIAQIFWGDARFKDDFAKGFLNL